MSSGLRANSVFATFGVKTDDWSKGLQKIAGDTAKTLKQVDAIGQKFGAMGLVWGASLGAAMKVAAGSSPALKSALKAVQNAALDVAAEIGIQFLPMMRKLADAARAAAKFVQSLSPELKSGIAHLAGYGTAAMLAAGVLGKFAGVGGAAFEGLKIAIGALAPAWEALTAIELSSLAPILAIVAGVALLVLGAGAFYKAWNTAGSGFKEKVQGILDTVMGWGRAVGDFFVGIWQNVTAFIQKAAMFMLDLFASEIRGIGAIVSKVADYLPDDIGKKVAGWGAAMEGMTGEKLLQGLGDVASYAWDKTKQIGSYLVDAAVKVGDGIADGVEYSIDGLKEMAADVAKKLGLDKLFSRSASNQSIHRKGEYDDAIAKIMFDAAKAMRGHDRDVGDRKTAFGNIGKTDEEVIAKATAGFANFDDALATYSGSLRDYEAKIAEAKIAEVKGNKALAMSLEVQAETIQETTTRAAKALDGFSEKASKLAQVKEDVKGRVMGASPEISSMANSVSQGAQMGGVWGAIIAVILELISKSQAFTDLLQMISGLFKVIGNILGQVLAPVLKILAPIFDIITSILGSVLTPIIKALSEPLEQIAPMFEIIAQVFKALEPMISMFTTVLMKIMNPLSILTNVAMKALFIAVKYLGLGVLYVAKGIASVWNGIISAISFIFHKIGQISILGAHPLSFLDDFGDTIDKAKLNTDNLDASIQNLKDATMESASAAAAESEERWKNVEATKQLNEALSNVPQGIKVAALRFRASDALGMTSARLTGMNSSGQIINNNSSTITVNVNGADASEVIAAIEQNERRRAFIRSGSSLVVAR